VIINALAIQTEWTVDNVQQAVGYRYYNGTTHVAVEYGQQDVLSHRGDGMNVTLAIAVYEGYAVVDMYTNGGLVTLATSLASLTGALFKAMAIILAAWELLRQCWNEAGLYIQQRRWGRLPPHSPSEPPPASRASSKIYPMTMLVAPGHSRDSVDMTRIEVETKAPLDESVRRQRTDNIVDGSAAGIELQLMQQKLAHMEEREKLLEREISESNQRRDRQIAQLESAMAEFLKKPAHQ
jgi:hypothetical protein